MIKKIFPFNKKSISIFVISLLTIGLFTIVLSSFTISQQKNDNKGNVYQDVLKIYAEALDTIIQHYTNIDEVNMKDLAYESISAMVKGLKDPYSHFLTPVQYQEMYSKTEGEFGGIGTVITIRDNQLTVISPIEDTPAYKAGIKAGDIITCIEGESTENMTLEEAVRRLRGTKGSKVTITIKRRDIEPFDVIITRDIIEIKSVKFAKINQEIGYLKIKEFNKKTEYYLENALSYFKKEGVKDIILDLRNNAGGLLDISVSCVSKFLPKEVVIVKVRGRTFYPQEYRAMNDDCYLFGLVVLVNGGTASGAEIVAGALQDLPIYKKYTISKEGYNKNYKDLHNKEKVSVIKEGNNYIIYEGIEGSDRAYLIGEKTFGKSSVQTVTRLSDGSAISLTTAYYYTPSGRLIHNSGIIPDKIVKSEKLDEVTEKELMRLEESGLLKEFEKKLKDFSLTNEQLNNFVDTLKKLGYKLPQSLIIRHIKDKIRQLKGESEPIFDLENDKQLQEAFFYLLKKHIKKTT